MRRVSCDLHLHSCLSPCGDNSMTPATAAGLTKLAGVDVAALTDHNTVRNGRAFAEACEAYGVSPLYGMELTTAEDIHMVCLFLTAEEAEAFEDQVWQERVLIRNRPGYFGDQLLMNADDEVVGEEPNFLPNATKLDLASAFSLVERSGGICWPAHIDRESNGIIAVLGTFPADPPFGIVEFRDPGNIPSYTEQYPNLKGLTTVYGSDSHRPEAVPEEAEFYMDVGDDGTPAEAVFRHLQTILRKG